MTTPTNLDRAASLDGRVAVVTGAASGMGAAIARLLADRGAKVALLARRRERLDDLAGAIEHDGGGRALALTVDVTRSETLRSAAEAVAAQLGRVDIVVNNAGVALAAPIEDGRVEEWQRMIDTNLTGVLQTLRAFLPALIEAGAEGPADLVNISSVVARMTFPRFSVYGATKAAVTYLSEALRSELSPRDVRVTNIEPGWTATELPNHVTDPTAREMIAQMAATIPALQPEEIAELIEFVVTRPAHFNLPHVIVMPTRQA